MEGASGGGLRTGQLDSSQRLLDQQARQQISRELGHERAKVTAIYLGTWDSHQFTLCKTNGFQQFGGSILSITPGEHKQMPLGTCCSDVQ